MRIVLGSGKGLRRSLFVPLTPDLPDGDKWSKTIQETTDSAPAGGPRTIDFYNNLYFSKIQI